MRGSGDGFVRGSDGHVRWGLNGAAGVVFVSLVDGDPAVLLQLRSAFSHEGGTWSCPGGALDDGETPYDGALREAAEEVGVPPPPLRLLGQYVFEPVTDWRYTTVVVAVAHPFGEPRNFETEAIEWVAVDDVAGRPLHAGFASAWPHVSAIARGAGDGR